MASETVTAAEAIRLLTPKRNKYKVAKPEDRTYDGILYASKFEMEYAQMLDAYKRSGLVEWWIRQHVFPLKVSGQHICNYIVDFVVISEGKKHYVEVKGMETPAYKLKYKLFKALYPDVDLRVVKRK
jgi:hypothetical protein